MNQSLTQKELEALKSFSVAWIKTYSCMPPEFILGIFLYLVRIAEHINKQASAIQTIRISQAATLPQYSNELRNIAAMSSMRTRL